MLKKILIFILIIILLVAGVFAYLYFFKKPSPTTPDEGFSLKDLFPFGNDDVNTNPRPDTTPIITPDNNQTPDDLITRPSLRLVTKGPISGATVFDVTRVKALDPTLPLLLPGGKPRPIETEEAYVARFVERATGHVSETYLDKIDIKKLTNTTIPKIYESSFAGGNKAVLLRYAEKGVIETFSGFIPEPVVATVSGGENTPILNLDLKGSYLPQNITAFAISPDSKKIFSLTPFDNGVVGTVSLPDGTKKSQIFSLAYTEWLAQWPSINLITLTTKPSATVPGYIYSLDPDKKIFKKIFGGVPGLTTNTSPDGKNILFSSSQNGQVSLNVYNIASRTNSPVLVTTLPEKCTWQSNTVLYCAVPTYMPNGNYPDIWYQGEVSFVDQIYMVNVATLEATVISNPASVQATIDAINLAVDPSNKYLIFTNKKDGSLWALELQ